MPPAAVKLANLVHIFCLACTAWWMGVSISHHILAPDLTLLVQSAIYNYMVAVQNREPEFVARAEEVSEQQLDVCSRSCAPKCTLQC